jgi:hypothetical protein
MPAQELSPQHNTKNLPQSVNTTLTTASLAVDRLILAQVMVLPKKRRGTNLLQVNARGYQHNLLITNPMLHTTACMTHFQAHTAALPLSVHLPRYQQLYTTHMLQYQPTANCC